jgi:hypothetical protein
VRGEVQELLGDKARGVLLYPPGGLVDLLARGLGADEHALRPVAFARLQYEFGQAV